MWQHFPTKLFNYNFGHVGNVKTGCRKTHVCQRYVFLELMYEAEAFVERKALHLLFGSAQAIHNG